jgi:nitrate reductase NapE component
MAGVKLLKALWSILAVIVIAGLGFVIVMIAVNR